MTIRRLAGVLVAIVTAVGAAGCGGSDEARQDLAFVSTRDGDYAVFTMDSKGGEQRRLTDDVGDPSDPDGLFFQVEPAWSPDGARIAFASRRSGSFDIYVVNEDGAGTTRLTSTNGADRHPTWSPKGDRIAFARDADIWVMRADGSNERRISGVGGDESEPAWSPDGAWIAYVRRTPGRAATEIWLMRPDGSGRRQVTNRGGMSIMPAWSPDSTRVVFASKGEIYALYTVGVDGRDIRTVVPTAYDNFEPSWSPDGSTIAYQEEGAIFTIELGGGGAVERLTDSADNDSSPVWNPQLPADDE